MRDDMRYPREPGRIAMCALAISYAIFVIALMSGHILVSLCVLGGYVSVFGWLVWRIRVKRVGRIP
jgi:hypothetical protein